MKNCALLDDLLLDGSPEALAVAETHAANCSACAASLAAWREISDTASSMHQEWQNDLLWPRIERELAAERRQRGPALRWWHAAAAMLILLLLGGTAVQALRSQNARADFDDDILRIAALDEVEEAERAYVKAIARLEQHAEAKLEDDASPLMVSYREKLMMLDDAIAECETNIERNRQNAHLRNQLLAMYSEKQATLQDVLREEIR